jgi:Vacuolar sorting 38 and autophagy-related subunit 14
MIIDESHNKIGTTMTSSSCPGCCSSVDNSAAFAVVATATNTILPSTNALQPQRSTCSRDSIHETTALLCPSCVRASLQSVQERHQMAKETWYEARMKSSRYFQQQREPQSQPSKLESLIPLYEQRYQQLRTELEALQQQCHTVTMDTCALNLQILERQEHLTQLQQQKEYNNINNNASSQCRLVLSQLQQSLCGNNDNDSKQHQQNNHDHDKTLNDSMSKDHHNQNDDEQTSHHTGIYFRNIEIAQIMVRTVRFHWTVQAFTLFRIQIDEHDLFKKANTTDTCSSHRSSNTTNTTMTSTTAVSNTIRNKSKLVVSGIGKICGLPLPHAGMELYGVLPDEELQSALRFVAQLTHLIARCLNLSLPHPILTKPPQSLVQPTHRITATATAVSPMSRKVSQPSQPLQPVLYDNGDIANLVYCERNTYIDGNFTSNTDAAGIINPMVGLSLTSLSTFISGGSGRPQPSNAVSASSDKNNNSKDNKGSQLHGDQTPLLQQLSMEPKHVEERILHATIGIIAEDRTCTTFYNLSTIHSDMIEQQQHPTTLERNQHNHNRATVHNVVHGNATLLSSITTTSSKQQQQIYDEFAIALQLLQNNILMICMNVGVPIDLLYPGEALLLNLYALQMFCTDNI